MGRAIKDSGIPREELWITSKVWPRASPDPARFVIESGQRSARELGTYMDLYLIHIPLPPGDTQTRVSNWLGMQELRQQGIAKSIGVSNYAAHHLQELLSDSRATVVPAINQIEIHPFCLYPKVVEACAAKGIVIEAYSPLARGEMMNDPTLKEVAQKHGRTPAQVMVRWSLQCGFVPLPKSTKPARMLENADVFGFELTPEEMAMLSRREQRFNSSGADMEAIP